MECFSIDFLERIILNWFSITKFTIMIHSPSHIFLPAAFAIATLVLVTRNCYSWSMFERCFKFNWCNDVVDLSVNVEDEYILLLCYLHTILYYQNLTSTIFPICKKLYCCTHTSRLGLQRRCSYGTVSSTPQCHNSVCFRV